MDFREIYARMNEGELEVVASEAYDLTDAAKPLLQAEILKRGLHIPLTTERPAKGAQPVKVVASGSFDPSKLDLVVAGTYWEIAQARKITSFLHEAGVPCYWGDKYAEDPAELSESFEQGVELAVREDDYPRVVATIREVFKDESQDTEQSEEFNIVCPKCKSQDIILNDLDSSSKFDWSCDACGHQWLDDGVA
jgi:hypothetical protein